MQANYIQLCSHQLNGMKTRDGNCLFWVKEQGGSVYWLRCGQPHSTQQHRVMDNSARCHCRHKAAWLVPQKGWMVPCWETLATLDPVPRVWASPGRAGCRGTHYSAMKGIRKSVLSSNTLLQTWAHGISSAGEEGWDAWDAALPAVMGWARMPLGEGDSRDCWAGTVIHFYFSMQALWAHQEVLSTC